MKIKTEYIYEKYMKRIFDIICAISAIVVFWWLYLILAMMIRLKLGSPVLFIQLRPGKIDKRTGRERIFKLYKFRTMTDERDANGNLLPDEKRMTPFGARLRETSLDELPELFNIIRGDMSLVGPRPQLVRDMVFMTPVQRMRHSVLPGLTGLAQINGRNNISWEDKLRWDLQYIKHISFRTDIAILLRTVFKVIKKDDIVTDGMETSEDLGDYLLRMEMVTPEEYAKKLSQVYDL